MDERKKDVRTIVEVRLQDGRTVRYRELPTEATRCRTIAEDGGEGVWRLVVYGATEEKPVDTTIQARADDSTQEDAMTDLTHEMADFRDEMVARSLDAPPEPLPKAFGGFLKAGTPKFQEAMEKRAASMPFAQGHLATAQAWS